MSMIKLRVTFEVNVYEGRLSAPFGAESNWDLWFYDNFVKSALNSDDLRPDEYIKVAGCEELTN